MPDDQNQHNPLATIPLPSADLINYRFDAQDKAIKELRTEAKQNFDALNHKLDYLSETFVTRVEFSDFRTAADKDRKDIWTAIDSFRRAARWWVATLIAFATMLAGFIYTLTHLHR